jgi:RNA polymerase primary sigma factor
MRHYSEVARNRLVNSNLKLVLAVVSRYRTSAIPNVELIAEGTRGLSKAALRYDYTKGFRFATYATWYVHQAIAEYVRWQKHPG